MTLKTRYRNYQILAFGLTFLSYTMYHAGRQPYSTTKSALAPYNNNSTSSSNEGGGYAPFNDGSEGVKYLGTLDTVFLAAYAVGMFVAGPLGDRVNIRLFLGVGMIGSGVFLGLNRHVLLLGRTFCGAAGPSRTSRLASFRPLAGPAVS